MRQMLTQAHTAGQYFTHDPIKEMTRKVSAEVDLVHQHTQNQRYCSSHIGATAKDISNVVTDTTRSGLQMFPVSDNTGADTWINYWKDVIFSSRRRHTRLQGDWSSDVCSSDLPGSMPSAICLVPPLHQIWRSWRGGIRPRH